MPSESLPLRAARYFGLEKEPRTSVRLCDGAIAIVCERRGQKVLAIYNEGRYGTREQRGTYSLLTEKRRQDFVDALSRKERGT